MAWLEALNVYLSAHPAVLAEACALAFLALIALNVAILLAVRRRPRVLAAVGRPDAPNSDLGVEPDPRAIEAASAEAGFERLRDVALQWGWQPADAAVLAAKALAEHPGSRPRRALRRVIDKLHGEARAERTDGED